MRKRNGDIDWEAIRNVAIFAAFVAVLFYFSSGSGECSPNLIRWGGCD